MKHMLPKILSLALCLAAGTPSLLAYDFEVDGIYYNFGSTAGTASVTSDASKYSGIVHIPETVSYEGTTYSVTEVGSSAFFSCSSLTEVTIPNSVTTIGNYAFSHCSSLTEVTIPNGVTAIGERAFDNCSNLTEIIIGNSVTTIGSYAFLYCSSLTEVTIPNSVTTIERDAFSNCSGLTEVTIGNSVTTIGNDAFSNCSGLTEVTIGNSVTTIGNNAFSGCRSLTEVTIPNSITEIGSSAFYNCSSLTEATIGNRVKTIGSRAFGNCKALTEITIPDSVSTIGANALSFCSALKEIIIGDGCTMIDSYAFEGCTELTKVTFGTGITKTGSYLFSKCKKLTEVHISDLAAWCQIEFGDEPFDCDHQIYVNGETLTHLVIPDEVTAIGPSAFYYCNSLTDVTIPQTVTKIGIEAFKKCSTLKVHIPDLSAWFNIEYGDYESFSSYYLYVNDEELTNLVIPAGITKIGRFAFYGCKSITEMTIPEFVTEILYSAFESCSNLATVYSLNPNPPSCWEDAFKWVDAILYVPTESISQYRSAREWKNFSVITTTEPIYALTFLVDGEVYWSDTLAYGDETTIPEEPEPREGYTFSGWNEVPETMPAQDVTIEGRFIPNVYALKYYVDGELYLTDSVACGAEIILAEEPVRENYRFSGWSELPEMMPAHDVTAEGSFLPYFVNVDGIYYHLDQATQTASVTAGEEKYRGIVTIPEEITYQDIAYRITAIDDYVFYQNDDLIEITIPDGVTIMCSFKYCSNLIKATIGNGITTIDSYAFESCTKLSEVIIGSSVTLLDSYAFHFCSSLKTVHSLNPEPPECREYAFMGVPLGKAVLYVPTGSIGRYSGWGGFSVVTTTEPIYALTFLVDGEVYQSDTLAYGDTIVAAQEPEAREGYTFSGWSEIPETMPNRNVTIEGAFTVNYYALTYLVDGEVYATDSVAYGTEIVAIEDPAKEGYTFSGWSELPETMPAEDVTIEGTFTANYYALTYLVDGEVYRTDSVAYGEVITPAVAPEAREGYIFSGWNELPETMPAHDVTVTGSFVLNEIPVTQIAVSAPAGTLRPSRTMQLTATVQPENATSHDVTWTSSDETIAEVDDSGLVTAVAAGTVTITATACDGSGATGSLDLTVLPVLLGDSNDDDRVTITDVVNTATYILGKPVAKFNAEAADVNGDERITVADISGTAGIVLNPTQSGLAAVAPRAQAWPADGDDAADALSIDDWTAAVGETVTLAVRLPRSAASYVALQADIAVPEGVTLEAVTAGPRAAAHHTLLSSRLDGRTMRVALFDTEVHEFADGDEALLELRVRVTDASAAGDVTMTNLLATDADVREHCLTACGGHYAGKPSDLALTAGTEGVRIEGGDGTVIVRHAEGQAVAIYRMDGTKVDAFTAAADEVRRSVPAGTYVVAVGRKAQRLVIR